MIDLNNVTKSKINENFLKNIKDKNKYNSISENGKAKTLIITVGENYLSPISSSTLFKRGDLGDITIGAYDAEGELM